MDITRKEHLGERLGAISWSSESTLVGVPCSPTPHIPWPGQPGSRGAGPWLLYQRLVGPTLLLTSCSGWSHLDLCGLYNHFPAGGSRVEAENCLIHRGSHLASVPTDQRLSFLTAQDSRTLHAVRAPSGLASGRQALPLSLTHVLMWGPGLAAHP